jgi:hypothetical protein
MRPGSPLAAEPDRQQRIDLTRAGAGEMKHPRCPRLGQLVDRRSRSGTTAAPTTARRSAATPAARPDSSVPGSS